MSASLPTLTDDGVLHRREDGLDEALLPSPTVQAHAANLALLGDGTLACTWFGGTQEGVADISVWFSRLEGVRWSDPVRLSDDMTRSEQNPVLFPAPDGRLWLVHTSQHAGNQDSAVVVARTSSDHGLTWGEPWTLLADPERGVFVRQPPVVLPDGRWVLPTFACVPPPGRRWVGDLDTSSVFVSADAGATWTEHGVADSTGSVHMNVVPTTKGYAAFYRSRRADHVHRSESADGVRWTVPVPTELPNNNSSVQAVALGEGRIAMVLNESSRLDATERRTSLYDEVDDDGLAEPGTVPTAAPETLVEGAFWGAPRAPMVLAVSEDGGVTWPLRRVIEDGDGYCLSNNSRDGLNHELSYPSLALDAVGDLHLAYTYHRRAIRHVRVGADELARWTARGA